MIHATNKPQRFVRTEYYDSRGRKCKTLALRPSELARGYLRPAGPGNVDALKQVTDKFTNIADDRWPIVWNFVSVRSLAASSRDEIKRDIATIMGDAFDNDRYHDNFMNNIVHVVLVERRKLFLEAIKNKRGYGALVLREYAAPGFDLATFAAKHYVTQVTALFAIFSLKYYYAPWAVSVAFEQGDIDNLLSTHSPCAIRDKRMFVRANRVDTVLNVRLLLEEHSKARMAEANLRAFLASRLDIYETAEVQQMQRERVGRVAALPDIVLRRPIRVYDYAINWIEIKNYVGAEVTWITDGLARQTSKYVAEYGAGIVVFTHGYFAGITKYQAPGVIIMDQNSAMKL
jgi:Protein of unknown function TPD sequence-motif